MRIFKTKWFDRFARQENIGDAALRGAVERAERGLIDADLGGGLIKQRVARPGAGKSGGYRTIISYRTASKAIFIFGFAKSGQENLSAVELAAFREVSEALLRLSDLEIASEIKRGRQAEIEWNDKNLQE